MPNPISVMPQARPGVLASGPQQPQQQPGRLDPYSEQAAALMAQGSMDRMTTAPQKMSILEHVGRALPVIGAAAATGGMALPFAAAFTAGMTGETLRKEKQQEFEWNRDRRLQGGIELGKAGEMHRSGLPPSATQRAGNLHWRRWQDENGKWWTQGHDSQYGQPMTEPMPSYGDPGRTADHDSVAGAMYGDKYINLSPAEKKAVDDYLSTSKVRTFRDAARDAEVTGGATALNAAEQEGTSSVQRQYQLRSVRDDINLNYLPMVAEMEEAAQMMLERIQANPGDFSFPVFGSLLANISPTLAIMQQYAAGEALQNLQITNLAPVTEKELEFIQTMAASPNAWNDEVNVARLKGTIAKISRGRKHTMNKLDYIREQLGEPKLESAAPGEVPGGPGEAAPPAELSEAVQFFLE